MNSIKSLVKKHPSALRYISIAGILTLIFPTFFIGEFCGNGGKYFALAIYLGIGILGGYEVLKNLNVSKSLALAISLSVALIFFYPTNGFLVDGDILSDAIRTNHVLAAVNNAINWKPILMIALMPLLLLLDKNMWTNDKQMIVQIGIATITLVLISVFAKFIWIVNVVNYVQLFYFLPIAIIADSFGYFGGKYLRQYFWNGKKLAPKLSPKKTWAGFIIGYIFSALFIGIVGWAMGVFNDLPNSTFILIFLTLVLPVISPMGDLMFSGFKRYLEIKDFSNLMPGHGGIMDRLDAMSSVVFAIFIVVVIAI